MLERDSARASGAASIGVAAPPSSSPDPFPQLPLIARRLTPALQRACAAAMAGETAAASARRFGTSPRTVEKQLQDARAQMYPGGAWEPIGAILWRARARELEAALAEAERLLSDLAAARTTIEAGRPGPFQLRHSPT